jgi:hypothetical protein
MEQEGMEDDATFSIGKATYNLVVTPTDSTPEDVINALDNIDNYGIYASNVRNTSIDQAKINKEIDLYFGPSNWRSKQSLERERGEPFPLRTGDAIKNFVKQFTSKPQLLKPTVEGNTVVFYQKDNPTKDLTKKILQVVLNNAEIKYKLSEKES